MNYFQYNSVNAAGLAVTDIVEASDIKEALQTLEQQGHRVESFRLLSAQEATMYLQQATFQRQTQLKLSGIPEYIPLLETLATKSTHRLVRKQIQQTIEKLSNSPNLDTLVEDCDTASLLPFLLSGPDTPAVSDGLEKWSLSLVQTQAATLARYRAMVYPILAIVLVLVVVTFMSQVVTPVFADMFDEFQLVIPLSTQLVVWLGQQFGEHYLRTFALLVAFLSGCYLLMSWSRKRALGRRMFGSLATGTTSQLQAMARFVGTLAELLQLGATLDQALPFAGKASGNAYFREAATALATDLANSSLIYGQSIAIRRLPPLLVHALWIQQPRARVSLLRELATLYQERSVQRSDQLSHIFPVFSVVLVAVLVGAFVVALFAPFFSLISSLSG